MRRIVIIASSMAGVFCATKIKRRVPDSEVNLILPSTLEKLQKPIGLVGKHIAKCLPNIEHLASRDIGVLEAHSIMTDFEKQEITVSSTRGNLPVRFGELLIEIPSMARLPRSLQKADNVFAWPISGFAADAEACDKAFEKAKANDKEVIVVGTGLPALEAAFLALQSGVKVHLICPQDQKEANIEPHLWQYLLKSLKEKLTSTVVAELASLTPLLDETKSTCLGLALPNGEKVAGSAYIWASQFMARHPILREDGFVLDDNGKICAEQGKNSNVYLFGAGAASKTLKITDNISVPIFTGGEDTAFATAVELAHKLSGLDINNAGLLGVHKASMPNRTVCRAGFTLADAAKVKIEAEQAIIAQAYTEDGFDGTLCLCLVVCKNTQTLLGVQCLGLDVPEAVVDGIFNSALGAFAERTPLPTLLCREYTGLAGFMLTRCASMLEHKLRGAVLGISPDELLASAEAGAEFFMLDLRSNFDWREKHLDNAYNIPLPQLKKRLQDEVPRFTPLVIICATGNDSHSIACKLAGLGASALYVLDGGMNLWPYEV